MEKTVNRLGTALKLGLAVGLSFVHVNAAYADSDGRAGRSGIPGGLTCATAACHTAGAAVPTVALTGPASVVAGATNTYTFTITGGPGSTATAGNAGLDISATVGTLAAPMAGTKILTNEVVNSAATPFPAGGTVTYTFDWTAPMTAGPATLYGAGLSGDGAVTRGGDGTATVMLAVIVISADPGTPPAPPPVPPPATTGEQLFIDNCAGCHGDGGVGTAAAPNIVGESAEGILEAFLEYPTEHAGLDVLTLEEVTAIAEFLTPPAADPVLGEQLFNDNCASCHGAGGVGTADAPNIVGESAEDILEAFLEYPTEHAGLDVLTLDEIDAIAAFLALGEEEEDIGDGLSPKAKNSDAAAGTLDWLTLFGAGAWMARRRRNKS